MLLGEDMEDERLDLWRLRKDNKGVNHVHRTPGMMIHDLTPEGAADLHDIFGDDKTMENCEPAYDNANIGGMK